MDRKQSEDLNDIIAMFVGIPTLLVAIPLLIYFAPNDKPHLKRWVVTQNGKTYVSKEMPSWHRFTYTVWTDDGQVILSAAHGEIVVRETMESEGQK